MLNNSFLSFFVKYWYRSRRNIVRFSWKKVVKFWLTGQSRISSRLNCSVERETHEKPKTSQQNTVGAGVFSISTLQASATSVLLHERLQCRRGKWDRFDLAKLAVFSWTQVYLNGESSWDIDLQTLSKFSPEIFGFISTMANRDSTST